MKEHLEKHCVARGGLDLARSIVDTVREPLLVLDEQLAVVSANRAFYQMFRMAPGETVGRRLFDLGGRQWDIPALRELLEQILSQNRAFDDFEVRHDFESLGPRTMLLNARRIDLEENQAAMILVAIEDVTERRRAEEELAQKAAALERSNRELEQFAYVASHDLQEPLRMVASYTELLAQRYEGQLDAKADKYIGYAVDGARRMQTLINDLLAFSRVGTRAAPPEPVPAGQAAADALRSLERAIAESGARVEVGELPVVMADRGQLTQVFQNLIANAIKFHGDAPPVVTLSATRQGAFWAIAVADNGIGIAPEHQQRIFTIFQRLHKRGAYPGSGMGLSIVKKIVERHGGRVEVESSPGKGATFRFTLPAADQESEEESHG